LRAALVVTALLSLAGCNRSLESYEPFACALDGTCPEGFGCDATKKCIGLSKLPVIPCTSKATCPSKMGCDPVSKTCLNDCSGGCSAETTCSQAGVCRPGKREGTPCTDPAECVDGKCGKFLTGSVCVTPCATTQDCESGSRACLGSCTNEGCTAAINLCRIPCTSCPAGWACSGDKGCQPGKVPGASCTADFQCASRKCEGPAGYGICVDPCNATTACPAGAMCQASTGYCVRACTGTQACPQGGSCTKGLCLPGKPVGAECTTSSECAAGSCRTSGYPGGVCVLEDCSTSNPCPQGSGCTTLCTTPDCLQVKSYCLASCTPGGTDCRSGYGCLATFGVNVCRPRGTGAEGQSCTTASDCASGFCLNSPAGLQCRTLCGSDLSCSGGICSSTTVHSNYQVCGSPCASGTCSSASDTCACFTTNGSNDGGVGRRGCQPKCTSDTHCFEGSVCNLATGLCGRKPCQNAAGCSPESFCTWNQAFDPTSCVLGSTYDSTCRPRFTGAPAVGARCTGAYCTDSICAGATAYTALGYCLVSCPDGTNTGCPTGTTCSTVDRPYNAFDGTGPVGSIKVCVPPPASNINGPCSATGGQCPMQQVCTGGFCDGKGQLTSPCQSHNPLLECSLPNTDYCTWRIESDGGSVLSTCSKVCTGVADCTDAGFVKGCCKVLNNGDKACWTQAMCGDAGN
jgi:hypothetical protein